VTGILLFVAAVIGWSLHRRLGRWSITAPIALTAAGLIASWSRADVGARSTRWIRI
jgi:hypothetical protein